MFFGGLCVTFFVIHGGNVKVKRSLHVRVVVNFFVRKSDKNFLKNLQVIEFVL